MFAAVLFILCACSGEPRSIPAGGGATATGSLSISATPIQTIAPLDSEGVALFGSIADATRLSSGVIAVVDRAFERVIFVDPAGGLVGRSGRSGEGPGEFRSIRGIGQCAPDTLFVWDPMNGRMSLLGPDGAFLSAFRPLGDPVDRYCAGSRRFLAWTRYASVGNPSADSPPIRAVAVLLSARGDSVGGLGEIQAGQNWPLGAITQFAVTDAGIYVGTADTAVVSLYSKSAQWIRAVDVGDARRATTATEYDAAIADLVATLPGTAEQVAGMTAFMHKRFPMPKYLPAYRALFSNGDGDLFVITSPVGAGVTEIHVFDKAGISLGEFRISGDLEIYEIGAAYLLGMVKNPVGEQRLVVYALSVETR